MKGLDIQNRILRSGQCMKRFFLGVFAADELEPALLNAEDKSFCVVNTHDSKQPVDQPGHWYVLFVTGKNCFELFDSLGLSEETARQRVGKDARHCVYNTLPVQTKDETCGKFATYFCVTRVLNYEETFQEVFSECLTSDLDFNEAIVDRFWHFDKLYNAKIF